MMIDDDRSKDDYDRLMMTNDRWMMIKEMMRMNDRKRLSIDDDY